MSTRIVAIANQKGGVGKTTTTYHLAWAAHKQGLKVLVIDTDPQGNLTTAMTQGTLSPETAGLADALTGTNETTMEQVLVPALWDGVDLVPATTPGLALVRDELFSLPMGREKKLKKAIHSLGEDRYDLVLIDCPPSMDQLTVNALVAATEVLIVSHTQVFSMNGITLLLGNIEQVQEHYNEDLTIAGIVINQFEKTHNDHQEAKLLLTQGAEEMGIYVFEPSIPKLKPISKTMATGDSLDAQKNETTLRLAAIYDRYISKLMKKA